MGRGLIVSEDFYGIPHITSQRWLPLLIPAQWTQIPVLFGINFCILLKLLLYHGFSNFRRDASVFVPMHFPRLQKKKIIGVDESRALFTRMILFICPFLFFHQQPDIPCPWVYTVPFHNV